MMIETKKSQRYLYLCGVIAPLLFVFLTILGGALRPGYSHISDTISELFSPGSPNKLLLDTLHTLFALLLTMFGIGLRQYFREQQQPSRIAVLGSWFYIAMGLLSLTTATIFPQDPWGSTPTWQGEMHKIMSGVISILTIIAILLIGIWFTRTKLFPGFGTYSFVTIGAVVLSAGVFAASMGGPWMGLAERITAFIGFLWTFTLALWLVRRSG